VSGTFIDSRWFFSLESVAWDDFLRTTAGRLVYHVLNRANARM